MAQSLANVLVHLVFSTKHRVPWIPPDIDEELSKYIAGICRNLNSPAHQLGGSDDHLHICCSLARTLTISKLVEEIKTGSSKWIKTQGEQFSNFAWQNGYGAFSIGQSQLADVRRYIVNQREHHRQKSFQEEFRALLAKYEIKFDERYVWD